MNTKITCLWLFLFFVFIFYFNLASCSPVLNFAVHLTPNKQTKNWQKNGQKANQKNLQIQKSRMFINVKNQIKMTVHNNQFWWNSYDSRFLVSMKEKTRIGKSFTWKNLKKLAWMYTELLIIVVSWFVQRKPLELKFTKKVLRKCHFCNSVLCRRAITQTLKRIIFNEILYQQKSWILYQNIFRFVGNRRYESISIIVCIRSFPGT